MAAVEFDGSVTVEADALVIVTILSASPRTRVYAVPVWALIVSGTSPAAPVTAPVRVLNEETPLLTLNSGVNGLRSTQAFPAPPMVWRMIAVRSPPGTEAPAARPAPPGATP